MRKPKKTKEVHFHLRLKNAFKESDNFILILHVKIIFLQKKYKHIFRLIFKITLAVLAFWYIYLKIKDFSFSDFAFPPFNLYSYFLFGIVILLMPVNWFTETVKWKFLIRKFENITFVNAFKAVISGTSFALISPNRIGELPGRVFILKKENRGKAVFSTAIGSLSQMLVTVVVGLFFGIAVLFFNPEYFEVLNSEQLFYLKIVSVSSVFFGFLLLFNLKYFVLLTGKLKINSKIFRYIEVLSEYTVKDLLLILGLSFLRYLIFSFQFVLLLHFFDVELSIYEAYTGIALTYLLSSLIPVLSIAEIGVRGSAAILFFGLFSDNIPGILSATTILWLINLAIPAVFGTIIFYKTKI